MTNRPTCRPPVSILITQGDAAGIGPDVILAALDRLDADAGFRVVIIGYPEHFKSRGNRIPRFLSDPAEALASESFVTGLMPAQHEWNRAVRAGEPDEISARAAMACLDLGIDLVTAEEGRALCTAPINKAELAKFGFRWPGHTEMLAERAGAGEFAMMLATERLRVVLATIHEPLARVPELLREADLTALLRLTDRSLAPLLGRRPRIGVAGLNPHAGEGGLFGREEIERIAPAVATARAEGIDARGPLSADTLFHLALEGEYDVVLAMYHDQGLIPIKTTDFHGGVNVTLGLPFVRTSPDHGTAYGLAGSGRADCRSMTRAIVTAAEMVRARSARTETRSAAASA